MMTDSFSLKIVQERGGKIRFIRALEAGRPSWFYLRLAPEKLTEYERALQQGSGDIRDYGTILESGWGDYPPADVIRFMESEYGFITPAIAG